MERFTVMIILALVTWTATGLLACNKKASWKLKYLPAFIVMILSIVFCVFLALFARSRYIGIAFVVIAANAFPAILMSLLTSAMIDLTRHLRAKKHRNRQDI